MKIDISQENFGILCICALRYCHGRKTYMPKLVQEICEKHLSEFSNSDLRTMLDDCLFQKDFNLYGDVLIDKPNWLKWQEKLLKEAKNRNMEVSRYAKSDEW